MAGSGNALQAAVYARLADDATLTTMIGPASVFDRRLTDKAMPYLVMSSITTADFGPGLEEHEFTLEVWSDTAGRKQSQEIAARVKVLLDGATLPVTGFTLVNLLHRSTRARREPRTRAQVAEMIFRAVTEN